MTDTDRTDELVRQWRCFHCDEVFTNASAACEHFGVDECAAIACSIDIASVREMEAELARYRAEDSDKDREIYGLVADHRRALVVEEQKGYDRGLADGREEAADRLTALTAENKRLREDRDELRKAILGHHPLIDLSNGQYVEMARDTEAGRRGALSRAEAAEARLAAIEQVTDVQDHRDAAYQNGWDDGYAEGFAKALSQHDGVSNGR